MSRIPTLYLTRTGMLEPLGQSQVLAYLKGLSSKYAITLISCERDADLSDSDNLAQIEAVCAEHGIRWVRLRYRRRPRIMASIINLTQLVYHAGIETRRVKAKLVHSRSYIPTAAAWAVSRISGTPYVFDMRSLWPEELITSRRMRRGSLLHKVLFWAERRLLIDAKIVVSLTHAGANYLEKVHPGTLPVEKLRIIPTCTDLDRFRPAPDSQASGVLIGCHGSLMNGWFRVDLLAKMFERFAIRLPEARFEIITREDPAAVRGALNAALGTVPDWHSRLEISAARASEIHEHLQRQSMSMFFYASGANSELGRSPTRMGEALGCGVPVVTNEGIGDVAQTVQRGGVGHVMKGEDDTAVAGAVESAIAILKDTDMSERCRRVAKQIYSLESGVRGYHEIYHYLVTADDDRQKEK